MTYTIEINAESSNAKAFLNYLKTLDFVKVKEEINEPENALKQALLNLTKTRKPNDITESEVVEECNSVRKDRYEKSYFPQK